MSIRRCTTCKKPFDTEQSPAMPFCSVRCRQIDLGRWLDEGYALPNDPSDEAPEEEHKAEQPED